jgi:hypothetical protein
MLGRVNIGVFELALTLGLSSGLHVAVLGSLPGGAGAFVDAESRRPSRVEFETIARPAEPEPPPASADPPPPQPPEIPRPIPRATRRKPEAVSAAPSQIIEAPTQAEPAPSQPPPTAAEQPPTAAAAPKLDLSARSAALSVWEPAAPSRPARSVAELELAASQALNRRLQPAPRDDQLEIKCNAEQRCEYRGQAIDATILPDGRVEYKEKSTGGKQQFGVRPPPATPTTPEDLRGPQRLEFSVRAEGRAVEAERARFLAQSEGLRRERADAWAKRIEEDGVRSFRLRLDKLWRDPSQSTERKRRWLFGAWEETSPDELGSRYRRLVLDYIRLNLPEHSDAAYSATELAALNAQRQQREPFAPYSPAP